MLGGGSFALCMLVSSTHVVVHAGFRARGAKGYRREMAIRRDTGIYLVSSVVPENSLRGGWHIQPIPWRSVANPFRKAQAAGASVTDEANSPSVVAPACGQAVLVDCRAIRSLPQLASGWGCAAHQRFSSATAASWSRGPWSMRTDNMCW